MGNQNLASAMTWDEAVQLLLDLDKRMNVLIALHETVVAELVEDRRERQMLAESVAELCFKRKRNAVL